jgi:hypothetical protein
LGEEAGVALGDSAIDPGSALCGLPASASTQFPGTSPAGSGETAQGRVNRRVAAAGARRTPSSFNGGEDQMILCLIQGFYTE